ncbi:MAG: hypothetical protein AMJ78_05495 [Omnitrophica WOR_2 bacterium SM23_29]|nr:MAG: hypothetical protein AMJ78_05495 [Omnitrophica WOR_2 bacterium SM23_29]
MKRIKFLAFFIILILVAVFFILNIKTTTRQGINYNVRTLKIPLYLKVLDFYDRHYNYKWLTHRITEGKISEKEKVMAIFKWTVENIAKQPPELKTVDDHVWHIIIRGYGTGDQFSDVFTTLCNYVGIDAFFFRLRNKDKTSLITFSFVKIAHKWYVFEPRNGIYFTKTDGSFASVEDIAEGNWTIRGIREDFNEKKVKYSDYFSEILSIDFERTHKWSRANIQSPINRFFYGVFKRYFIKIPNSILFPNYYI